MSLDALRNNAKSVQAVEGNIRAIGNDIIVEDMNFGMRQTQNGIILQADDGKDAGIRARWAKVYTVGPEQKDVSPAQWILIEHGRWTRSFRNIDADGVERELRRADPECVLATWTGESAPQDDYVADL